MLLFDFNRRKTVKLGKKRINKVNIEFDISHIDMEKLTLNEMHQIIETTFNKYDINSWVDDTYFYIKCINTNPNDVNDFVDAEAWYDSCLEHLIKLLTIDEQRREEKILGLRTIKDSDKINMRILSLMKIINNKSKINVFNVDFEYKNICFSMVR